MKKTKPLQILPINAEILKNPTNRVTSFDEDLKNLLKAMYETMLSAKGIGLSANQVGIDKCIFVMELQNGERRNIINPVLVGRSDKFFYIEEGCLSLPGAHIGVRTRSESVTVKYQDADGLEKIETFTEIDAVCVQHEMEHLAGESYLKHLNRHDRRKILKKYL